MTCVQILLKYTYTHYFGYSKHYAPSYLHGYVQLNGPMLIYQNSTFIWILITKTSKQMVFLIDFVDAIRMDKQRYKFI